jgi:hypothetical protein
MRKFSYADILRTAPVAHRVEGTHSLSFHGERCGMMYHEDDWDEETKCMHGGGKPELGMPGFTLPV